MTVAWEVVCGDAVDVLSKVRADVFQCCVTSPPYYGLRDYGVEGQIGLEETPEAYVDHLVAVFREVRRTLRNDGTLWLNLGDSYAGSGCGGGGKNRAGLSDVAKNKQASWKENGRTPDGFKPKDLIGIPWMAAFALRTDGWFLRSDIIWNKPNAMPSSVSDRCTSSHEYLFMLAKSARYYYDNIAILEDSVCDYKPRTKSRVRNVGGREDGFTTPDGNVATTVPGKRNRRDVWTLASQPCKEAHFATFPPALVEPCILAGTSEHGACPTCGAPYERIVERTAMVVQPSTRREEAHAVGAGGGRTMLSGTMLAAPTTTTTGWKQACLCPAATPVPCLVLDPFCGAGTTGVVATTKGRAFLGVDINETYCETIARPRITRGLLP